MTIDQVGIIVLLGVMFIAYALDRFRIELVALTGLATAFAIGLVPSTALFGGFSSPAVITVVEILLMVSVLARTRAGERSEEHTFELQSLIRNSVAVLRLHKHKHQTLYTYRI